MSLSKDLKEEIDRVTKLTDAYKQHPTGGFATIFLEASIDNAKEILKTGNQKQMLIAIKDLRDYEL